MTIKELLQKINNQADLYALKGRDPKLPRARREHCSDLADSLIELHQRLFNLSIAKHDQEIVVLTQCINDSGAEADLLNRQLAGLTKKIAELRGLVAEGNEVLCNVLEKVDAVKGLLEDEEAG